MIYGEILGYPSLRLAPVPNSIPGSIREGGLSFVIVAIVSSPEEMQQFALEFIDGCTNGYYLFVAAPIPSIREGKEMIALYARVQDEEAVL